MKKRVQLLKVILATCCITDVFCSLLFIKPNMKCAPVDPQPVYVGNFTKHMCVQQCILQKCSDIVMDSIEGSPFYKCNLGNIGGFEPKISGPWKSILFEHRNLTDPFLNKFVNCSSEYSSTTKCEKSVDGLSNTFFRSKKENSNWWYVDLGQAHFMMEIFFKTHSSFTIGLEVYMSENISFNEAGTLNRPSDTPFITITETANTYTFTNGTTGFCLRYLTLYRETVSSSYLFVYSVVGKGGYK